MYKIAEYDLVSIGRNGVGSIRCKVTGFWSGDSITLYIDRRFSTATEPGWRITLSNSSGGRDTDEVADDLDAYKNYAAALEAMCDVGKMVRMELPKMEAAYQVQREADRQEREAQKAAEQAEIDADAPLGEVGAAMLVEEMALTGAYAHAFRRGNGHAYLVECVRREKTKYYFCGSIIAKKALIAKLAEYSARTGIPAELKAA